MTAFNEALTLFADRGKWNTSPRARYQLRGGKEKKKRKNIKTMFTDSI